MSGAAGPAAVHESPGKPTTQGLRPAGPAAGIALRLALPGARLIPGQQGEGPMHPARCLPHSRAHQSRIRTCQTSSVRQPEGLSQFGCLILHACATAATVVPWAGASAWSLHQPGCRAAGVRRSKASAAAPGRGRRYSRNNGADQGRMQSGRHLDNRQMGAAHPVWCAGRGSRLNMQLTEININNISTSTNHMHHHPVYRKGAVLLPAFI
jgi:hypothetical protein